MDLALSLGEPQSHPPPPTKTTSKNIGLSLWFSAGSSLKSHTQEPHNPATSHYPPLQLGLPWSNETATVASPGSGKTVTSGSDDEETGLSSARKKLRLSKEQAVYLEERFTEHQTLNQKQKRELAKELGVRPRQVEVWFQNRRVRTKLKQTEVDCSYLKRYCDAQGAENRRLQKEISDLRALNAVQPFYMQFPATTLSMCPNCGQIKAMGSGSAAVIDHRKAPSVTALLDKHGFFRFAGYAAASHQSSTA